ncbi:MAG: aldehyde dehydrogenase family protein [Planktomarina temperata]|jgi:aldehyde dehydrogenase (NAD+)|uniref:aldehyde dehydrogenase family protein n=2 Tax=Paracoccaceae TaxID=31989 RepID=UPI0023031631|nr:aldehyde dehydrogenase family protein [Planktomarina temperata]MDA9812169.1 aldehyde dehydrogenase family protein [bacterium]MDC0122446.1 aldehyde dehydrogenase family protein [Planktomarina sp.]MDA8883791.1 aldehyde dehydrogenase family protein [Planktomarina temperata]MDA8907753.1 aldehyde dehydrogenase family protein [Planktomarina temperata]
MTVDTSNLGKFYIAGQWVAPRSQANMPVLNPANERQIGIVPLGDAADVDEAVAAAVSAFPAYSQTRKSERVALLQSLMKVTQSRFEDLAQAMRMEMGAPITMAREAQADAAIGHLQGFMDALAELVERETLSNGDILLREPIGVCGLITPWNWPMNQIALKVIPALATGCCCVLKPSEHTPISAMIYAEIIDAAGFPPGVFNLVQGDGPTVGAALSRHKDVQMMSFTGSTRAGTAVTRDAAETVKRVTLELGGKSPNLVFADCDLEAQVSASVAECMYNTGQSCDAPTRLLAQRSCYEAVLEIAKRVAEATEVGDPAQEGAHIGPLFDRIQFDRVQAMIKVGLEEGARLLAGGLGRPEGIDAGWFVKPTIFCDVSNDMRIAQEEIFGPVLVIIPFEDEAEAIEIANDTPYGLAAYLQTGDPARAERVAARLRAGAIHINGGGFNYGSPFGGYKQSGNGREGGMMGLEDYLETKTLHGLG